MGDSAELKKAILQFRDDRNWQQFHKVKDLLLGLKIETAELAELFLFKSDAEVAEVDKENIADEMADIFVYLNYLAEHFDIDLHEATFNKLEKNKLKYPVDKAKDSNKKYDEL